MDLNVKFNEPNVSFADCKYFPYSRHSLKFNKIKYKIYVYLKIFIIILEINSIEVVKTSLHES